jgi:hypothetical protein
MHNYSNASHSKGSRFVNHPIHMNYQRILIVVLEESEAFAPDPNKRPIGAWLRSPHVLSIRLVPKHQHQDQDKRSKYYEM